ncbi:hypothetical protein IWQ61_009742 [Dispira simplex]|nr:hypothetical protein IWQ61_009742 [Dispira simplex]
MTADEAYFHYTRGLKNALFQSVKIAQITTLDDAQSYVLDLEEALDPRIFTSAITNQINPSVLTPKSSVPTGNNETKSEPMDLGIIK